MAQLVRTYSTNAANETTSLTVTYPLNETGQGGQQFPQNSPPQNGQSMILAVGWFPYSGTPTVTVSGWTQEATIGNGLRLYSKQGDGSSGSASIVFSSPCRATGTISLVDGSATSSLVDVTGTISTSPSSQGIHTGPSVNTTVANTLLLGAWSGDGDDGWWWQTSLPPNYVFDYSYFFEAFGGSSLVAQHYPGGAETGIGVPLTVGWMNVPTAGATGQKIGLARNFFPAESGSTQAETMASARIAMIAIKPFTGPSVPTITAPVTSENITIGRLYDATWTPSTDPVIAQSSLTYNLDYSLNDGTSWTQIVANTSGGAITYPWNTAGLTPTSQARLRLRAHNGTDYSVTYYTTGRFTLSTDVTPLAPSNMRGEQPDGTSVSLFDIGVGLVIKGTFNDTGDVMTAFQLDWGTDGVTYGNTSTNTTSTLAKTYAASTFSAGTIYFRCRTADNAATYGPYATFSLTAAAAPATPNITAPTFASPPASATPTISWTSSGQVKYRIRITQAGVEKYNGGFVSSGSQAVTSPYSFANSTTYTLYLSVEASTGLRSTEDSETFTASYIGPDTPTILVTPSATIGLISIVISNPDVPAYNEVWRYLSTQTTDDAIRIAKNLPVNASFADYTATSGQGYIYFARAYLSSGGFTNSVVSSTVTLNLSRLWLHTVLEADGTESNAGQVVNLSNMAPSEYSQEKVQERKKARGRTRPVTVMGQQTLRRANYQVIFTPTEISGGFIDSLTSIFNANVMLCSRDQRGIKLFGKVTNLPMVHGRPLTTLPLEVRESDFTEGV